MGKRLYLYIWMSIRVKWTLAFFGVIVVTLGAEWIFLQHWVRLDLEKQLKSHLSVQANFLGSSIEQNLIHSGTLKDASKLALIPRTSDPSLRIRVSQIDGKLVFDSDFSDNSSQEIEAQSLAALGGSESKWESPEAFYDAYPIHEFSDVVGIIECSASKKTLYPTLRLLSHALGGTMLVVSFAGVFGAFMIASTLVKPIRELGNVAEEISQGSWEKRVRFHRTDELGQLAEKIHAMAERLKLQFNELEAEKSTFQALLTSMIDGLIVLDERLHVQFLNPQAEHTLRVKSEEVNGKSLDSVWPLRHVQEMVQEGLYNKTIVTREIMLPYNVLKVYVVPMAAATGASVMLVFRDITELRRLEDLRNQFLGQASHELRTPLTIIKGYVITLLDDPRLADAPQDIKKILLRIEEESDRLSKLVEEVLELSRLKGGKTALSFVPVSLTKLVAETIESLSSYATRYQISIDLKIEDSIPQILGDLNGLKRILLNLLDNAMKYSPKGGQVHTELSGTVDRAILKVTDHGAGISKEDLPHVFERFFQGKKKEQRKGWGLGLPIVKEIVEAHGGRIRIESIEHQGTTVTVLLPAKGFQIEERKV